MWSTSILLIFEGCVVYVVVVTSTLLIFNIYCSTIFYRRCVFMMDNSRTSHSLKICSRPHSKPRASGSIPLSPISSISSCLALSNIGERACALTANSAGAQLTTIFSFVDPMAAQQPSAQQPSLLSNTHATSQSAASLLSTAFRAAVPLFAASATRCATSFKTPCFAKDSQHLHFPPRTRSETFPFQFPSFSYPLASNNTSTSNVLNFTLASDHMPLLTPSLLPVLPSTLLPAPLHFSKYSSFYSTANQVCITRFLCTVLV